MKKFFAFIKILSLCMSATAQPLQHVMQRSSINVAAMSELENLQAFLCGQQSFAGFEGAPRNVWLNVASPMTGLSQISDMYSSKSRRSDGLIRHFVGGTIAHESYGVHSKFRATVAYNYRLLVSESATITLGLGAGMKTISSDYGQWDPEASVFSKKETLLAMQLGARLEMDRLSIAAFSNDSEYSGEVVWGRLWEENSRHIVARNETWRAQFSATVRHDHSTQTNTFGISANTVYKDGLGVGMSYETEKNLSINIHVRVMRVMRIGYAYQLLHLNPLAPKREIVVRYGTGKNKERWY